MGGSLQIVGKFTGLVSLQSYSLRMWLTTAKIKSVFCN